MSINLLDCTLREAPIKNLFFGEEYVQKFINSLEKSNIDIIECGFLKNGEYILGSTIFTKTEQIEPYLKNKNPNLSYVALVDYGRYNLSNLEPYNGKSIDGIRICFKKTEKDEVFSYAKEIQNKGYKVFIQHVDTLDYSDIEIIEFIQKVNILKPYAYSIVDTFGSMYADDVIHLYSLINRHLDSNIKLGFHAHNNLMLAAANSQLFITLAYATRDIMIDGSILGCGRGAGNAHTELMVQFINKKFKGKYKINELLDLIDNLTPKLKKECQWGYSIPYFLSGIHSSHVFNVNHLLRRHNILSKDLRIIIEKLNNEQKKQYDYSLLEKLYVEHFSNNINEKETLGKLRNLIQNKKILFLIPGNSLKKYEKEIQEFINKEQPFTISLNHYNSKFKADIIFFSSQKRYLEFKNQDNLKLLLTSNIKTKANLNEMIVNYSSLIKYGWINLDISIIMALRLFLKEGGKKFIFAGFDGFFQENKNYYSDSLISSTNKEDLLLANKEIKEMLNDILKKYQIQASFLTPSIFEECFKTQGK